MTTRCEERRSSFNHAFGTIEEIAALNTDVLAVLDDTAEVPDSGAPGSQRNTKPFSADNARLAGLTSWRYGKKIASHHALADDVWISFAADVDVYPSTDLDGLVINVNDIGTSP